MVASKPDPNDIVVATTKASGADIDEPLPPRHKLPPKLQAIVDKAEKEDSLYDELWEGTCVSPSPTFLPLKLFVIIFP